MGRRESPAHADDDAQRTRRASLLPTSRRSSASRICEKRIDLDLRALDNATELTDVLKLFEEAEAVGGETTHRIGKRAVERADALLKATRGRTLGGMMPQAATSPDARLVNDIRERFAAWAKANPITVQRLRQVTDRKAVLEQTLNSQRERWLTAYGLL